ncbi:porin [Burkholderia cepacia]|nr:porin [Burkholderia cepacia]
MKSRTCVTLACVAGVTASPGIVAAETIELYVDRKTQQIFASPGPDRDRIGTFEQVHKPGASTQAESTPVTPSASSKILPAPSVVSAPMDAPATAQTTQKSADEKSKWYDRISLRGYTQFRFNHGAGGNAYGLRSPGDRFIGDNQGFGLRRARIVLSGDLHERLSIYLQQDLVSIPSGSSTWNFGQVRDAYADIYLDKAREFRLRAGQSKVPYGWENLQSSQNRLTPDRADALNSAVKDERDIGVFFYYTPSEIRERFKYLVNSGLKGSGDYGVFGLGVYNGQGANRPERNNRLHTVVHLTYPFKLPNGQFLELGVDAYTGRFKVASPSAITVDGKKITPVDSSPSRGTTDQRVAVHAIYYPQPFGLQAEWTVGRGPQLDLANGIIGTRSLHGGYVQAMYKFDHPSVGSVIPYVKWQTYRGASKFDTNNPRMRVNELEIGTEWRPFDALELTAAYSRMRRTDLSEAPYRTVAGNLLRFQLQVNY